MNPHPCMQLTEPPFTPIVPTQSHYNQQFRWKFTMAAVDRPLLDSDFMATHGFLVDLQGRRFIHSTTFCSLRLHVEQNPTSHLSTLAPQSEGFEACAYGVPRSHYSNVLRGVSEALSISPHHHHWEPGTPNKLHLARDEFHAMECMGIVHRSNSLGVCRCTWLANNQMHIFPQS